MADSPVQVDVVEEQVDAQVTGAPREEPDKVDVHEVSVQLDQPVLDANSPEAVQTEGGEGSTELPIHQLSQPSPEEALESGDAPEHEPGSGPVASEDDES